MVQRGRTGLGQHIDMSLLDVATSIMANQAMNYLATGKAPGKMGNAHPNLTPYAVYDCADGWIIIAVGNDHQFQRLCEAIGRPELGQHADFLTNSDRIAHRADLTAQITAATTKMRKTELLTLCERVGVPAGPINDLKEVFDDPHVIARGMQIMVDGVPGVRSPMTFSGADLNLAHTAPKLGEHDTPQPHHLGKNTPQG